MPSSGFALNGEPSSSRAAACTTTTARSAPRRLTAPRNAASKLMKANGFNAIRTSHNPPSPAFLDACDRLGMLVMDEAFDQWERPKNPHDYHRFFKDWWRARPRRDGPARPQSP